MAGQSSVQLLFMEQSPVLPTTKKMTAARAMRTGESPRTAVITSCRGHRKGDCKGVVDADAAL